MHCWHRAFTYVLCSHSCFNKLCNCKIFLFFLFLLCWLSLGWGITNNFLSFVAGGFGLILSCVALVDFLGNTFLTSCLLLVSAIFSLPFSFFVANSYGSVFANFFFGDLLKKEVMIDWFTSRSLGKGDNEDSSLSMAWLSSLGPTSVSCHSGSFNLTVGSTYCDSATWVESFEVGKQSMGCAMTVEVCCIFQIVLP